MASKKKPARRPDEGEPLLSPADFTSYLREKADELAPGDLEPILKQADAAHRRAASVNADHPRLGRQVELSLQVIGDHVAGECQQIPFHTISILAVSMLYLLNPVDVIPDWIPGTGSADDALLFELAFKLARPGIERYCTWKAIDTNGLLPPPEAPKAAASKRRGKQA